MLGRISTAMRAAAHTAESTLDFPPRAPLFNHLFSTESFHPNLDSPPLRLVDRGDTMPTCISNLHSTESHLVLSTATNELIGDLRILIFTNSFNSMAQCTHLEIQDTYGSDVCIELAIDEKQLLDSVKRHDPDIILFPFLTKRIPEEIWRDTSRLCLIVHPGIHGDRGASSIDRALKEKNAEWGVGSGE